MDERDFVTKKRETWEQLGAIITRASGRSGTRRLSREELLAAGPLYRRVCSDLAYARAHNVGGDLAAHLNDLVGQAHALLYGMEAGGQRARAILQFYLFDFPALLQRRLRYFLAAMGITFLGAFYAYWFVTAYPAQSDVFIPPQMKASVEQWKQGAVKHDSSAEFSGALFTNNQRVGLIAYASGIAAGVPTCYLLFTNGSTIGALAAEVTIVHQHGKLWPGILPHGIAELTAIFICGAAGLLLGGALLFPGPYHRADAFRRAGLDSIYLVLGSIPLFIFAGIVEGMFSHLGLAAWVRLTFAGINGTLWYLYLFAPRREPIMAGARLSPGTTPALNA